MNPQSKSALIASALGGVAVACLGLLLVFVLETRSLRRELTDFRRLWTEAVNESAALRNEQAATAAALATQRDRVAELEQRLAEAQKPADPNPNAAPGRARLARIYANGRLVGSGWVIAGNTNAPGTGRDGLDSVVLAPPSATAANRAAFAGAPNSAPTTSAAFASTYSYTTYPYGYFYGYGGWAPNPPPDGERPPPDGTPNPPDDPGTATPPAPPVQTRTMMARPDFTPSAVNLPLRPTPVTFQRTPPAIATPTFNAVRSAAVPRIATTAPGMMPGAAAPVIRSR